LIRGEEMTRSLTAVFDGKIIVPDKPVRLPVGKPLQIKVALRAKKPVPRTKRPRIIGLGEFSSGVRDLGSNKNHLKGFGK
jgi:hypothetical protein